MILESIRLYTQFLAQKGVDSPRLQAELLLAHALGVPRLNLYLDFQRMLSGEEVDTVSRLVSRRGNREPLQHILGTASFCGLEMLVSPMVLIPRPETELLAERAWQFLQTNPALSRGSSVLDFGTGSGCLAIAIAVYCPTAKVHAIDISTDAIAVARTNALRHQVADRIHFCAGDGFAALPHGLVFDLLVANPPYIPTAQIGQLQPEVGVFEPRLALDGGPEGLDFYRKLADQAPAFLRPQGRLMMEIGDGQAKPVLEWFSAPPWQLEAMVKDDSGRLRIVQAARHDSSPVNEIPIAQSGAKPDYGRQRDR
ncbi:MAG: peptide chain release factor N(5)-glutamine methyltransferase [Candidatus Omnitrophica bacterium]|nr:peptide chain release factor N(5)-glutamine methyltransferase [Candidatus Omnitrophota bacterium]